MGVDGDIDDSSSNGLLPCYATLTDRRRNRTMGTAGDVLAASNITHDEVQRHIEEGTSGENSSGNESHEEVYLTGAKNQVREQVIGHHGHGDQRDSPHDTNRYEDRDPEQGQENIPQSPTLDAVQQEESTHDDSSGRPSIRNRQATIIEMDPSNTHPVEFVGLNETSNESRSRPRPNDLFVNISPSIQGLAQMLANADNAGVGDNGDVSTPVQNDDDAQFEQNNETMLGGPNDGAEGDLDRNESTPVVPSSGRDNTLTSAASTQANSGPAQSSSTSNPNSISVVTANGTPVNSSNFEPIPVPEYTRASAEFTRRAKEQHSKIRASKSALAAANGTSTSNSPLSSSPLNADAQEGSKEATVKPKKHQLNPYSIRLSPFVDHSANVPSFYVQAVERHVKGEMCIAVGRYDSRKEPDPNAEPPIVFRSKVVSRSHAELKVDKEGHWFIRDVGSSSGTMINRARLSQANEPSPFAPIKDGDILQFGVDYRGGLEEAFRCIKVYVELNRSWKRKANGYNKSALDRLRHLTIGADSDGDSSVDAMPNSSSLLTHDHHHDDNHDHSTTTATRAKPKPSSNDMPLQECVICLQPLGPCQALFVGPCSHGWHYKCIRPIIVRSYPHFLCPNCRTMWDLEADIDESEDDEENDEV